MQDVFIVDLIGGEQLVLFEKSKETAREHAERLGLTVTGVSLPPGYTDRHK